MFLVTNIHGPSLLTNISSFSLNVLAVPRCDRTHITPLSDGTATYQIGMTTTLSSSPVVIAAARSTFEMNIESQKQMSERVSNLIFLINIRWIFNSLH